MRERPFHIVDVFAEHRYAGNQLAVVTDADGLSTEQMQRIAREMNFSETSFLMSPHAKDGGYDVRIFTPAVELPFAGHPTLGTAHVVNEELLEGKVGGLALNLEAGRIPVTFESRDDESAVVWMRQLPPTFGETFDGRRLMSLLGLEASDYDDRFPAQQVSTGVPFLIVPIKGLAAVERARFDHVSAAELGEVSKKAIYFFCGEAREPDNDLHARLFAEGLGVPEDPATGSAAGCLAGFLVQHEYLGSDSIDARVEQGHEIGRPSLLKLKAHRGTGGIEIKVGGRVFAVARGQLLG